MNNTTKAAASTACGSAVKGSLSVSQRAICLTYVKSYPGQTAAEIAVQTGLDRFVPSRRLPELRRRGLVVNGIARVCSITGRSSMVWFPVGLNSPGRGGVR